MSDERIRGNLQRMMTAGASETDIDIYLRSEGGDPSEPLGAQQPPSLKTRAQETFGFDPNIARRGAFLPLARNKQDGMEVAWPQAVVDTAQSFLAPGHALHEGPIQEKDATKFALDFLAPAAVASKLRRRGVPVISDRQLAKKAKTSSELKKSSSGLYKKADDAPTVVSADEYANVLADLEQQMADARIHPKRHPDTTTTLEMLADDLGKDMTAADLGNIRPIIADAAYSNKPGGGADRRLAQQLLERFDDMLDTATAGASKAARAEYLKQRKAQTIERIIETAEVQASGDENGIRIGFRALLKKIIAGKERGWTGAEKKLIKEVVHGKPSTKAMRWLAGFAPVGKAGESQRLLSLLGMGAGATAGSAFGPVGAAVGLTAPLIAGSLAKKGASKATRRAADVAKAAATTGIAPGSRGLIPSTDALMRMNLMGVGAKMDRGLLGNPDWLTPEMLKNGA